MGKPWEKYRKTVIDSFWFAQTIVKKAIEMVPHPPNKKQPRGYSSGADIDWNVHNILMEKKQQKL